MEPEERGLTEKEGKKGKVMSHLYSEPPSPNYIVPMIAL